MYAKLIGYVGNIGKIAMVSTALMVGFSSNAQSNEFGCERLITVDSLTCIFNLEKFLKFYNESETNPVNVTFNDYTKSSLRRYGEGFADSCGKNIHCMYVDFDVLDINRDCIISRSDDLNKDNKIDKNDADLVEYKPVQSCRPMS